MLDQYDILILKEFLKIKPKQSRSTWDIMKSIYPAGQDREHTKIKRKIERMAELGLFLINGDKRKEYTLDKNKAVFSDFTFPKRISKGIAVKIDEKWMIYEL